MKNKVDAVYELRQAAEEHGRAEKIVETDRSPENVDALLEAKERLELKTVEAINACEHCGETHCDDASHKPTNIIRVEFSRAPQDDETG